MRIAIWKEGQSLNKSFLDGRFDFTLRKPSANYNVSINEPVTWSLKPLVDKQITIEKAFIGKDNLVHVIVLVEGNPIWTIVIVVGAVALAIGMAIWFLIRIERILSGKMLFGVVIVLVIVIGGIYMIRRFT